MSGNYKSKIHKSFMSNFTNKKKHRYILTEKGSQLDSYLKENLNKINDYVNYTIQELSIMICDRQIPYMIIEQLPVDFSCDVYETSQGSKVQRIRGLLRDSNTEQELIKLLGEQLLKDNPKLSHMIEFFGQTTYSALTFSNFQFDAKMYLNSKEYISVFTDIFLDSAMFNSYSFLKEMNDDEKHKFGQKKLEFYRNRGLSCFYRFDTEDEDKLFYYSLAFSCRKNTTEFDYEKYINLWNDFIKEYYPDKVHKEKSVAEQLKQHVDSKQLAKKLTKKILTKGNGAYLVLKINKDNTPSLHPRILSYFGLKKYTKKAFKVVPIEEYYNIQDMLKNLSVSAYKVIVKIEGNK